MILSSPLFLIGLTALVVPIAVHLFNFRRYKKVYFSNVEFLDEIQSESRRQSNLRRLLILLVRCLMIVFLVLAFAQPVIPNKQATDEAGATNVSIYLDNSFSMDNTEEGEHLIEVAKTKAKEVVMGYERSDRFHLITNDMMGRQFHWLSQEEVLEAIEEVELSSATPKLSEVATPLFAFLRSGNGRNRHAYFVSDFQVSMTDVDQFPRDSMVQSTFVPLSGKQQNNVFIDSLSFNAPVFYKGNNVVASVFVTNASDENLEKIPISLYLGDRQRAVSTVDLPAGSTETVDLHFSIDEEGILDGRVEITDYPITFDDRYYFSLNIRNRIDALLIEGSTPNTSIRKLFETDSTVILRKVSSNAIDFGQLTENDIILVDEMATISDGMVQTLREFAESGSVVVLIPSRQADQESYNKLLRSISAPTLSGWSEKALSVTKIEYSNMLYGNVFAATPSDIEMPTVKGYYTLAREGATLLDPILTFANGDSYLAAVPIGQGRLYLFTAPLRAENTDFVHQALLVPTLYNMALYSVPPTVLATTTDNQRPIPLYGLKEADVDASLVRLQGVDYEEIPDIRKSGNHYLFTPHRTIPTAGNYRLAVDKKELMGISFNYSRRESLMQFLTYDQLTEQLVGNGLPNCQVVKQVGKSLSEYIRAQREGRPLWRVCLFLVLLMIVVEIILIKVPTRETKKNKQKR